MQECKLAASCSHSLNPAGLVTGHGGSLPGMQCYAVWTTGSCEPCFPHAACPPACLHACCSHCRPASPCSDEALAALLCQLHRLQVLSLERCTEAGDDALAALAKHVSCLHCQLPVASSLLHAGPGAASAAPGMRRSADCTATHPPSKPVRCSQHLLTCLCRLWACASCAWHTRM